jgi:hypothetical protein
MGSFFFVEPHGAWSAFLQFKGPLQKQRLAIAAFVWSTESLTCIARTHARRVDRLKVLPCICSTVRRTISHFQLRIAMATHTHKRTHAHDRTTKDISHSFILYSTCGSIVVPWQWARPVSLQHFNNNRNITLGRHHRESHLHKAMHRCGPTYIVG